MKKFILSIISILLCTTMLFGCVDNSANAPADDASETMLDAKLETTDQQSSVETQTAITYADTISWDAEYDVVVVGFGGAGAAASIAAAEEGANVLLTEKAPEGHAGGNTRYSYQIILNYTDYDEGVKYLEAECEGMDNMTPEIIDFIVKSSMENADWLESIGVNRPVNRMVGGEYPEFPGAESVVFSYVPDDAGEHVSTKEYWFGMQDAVTSRSDNIDVWYESPAVHLIQDPFSKTVLGAQIERKGEMVNVRAKNGVVLACGGFENNEEMIEHYTQREALYPIGTLYNTGDGVQMAIEVGADLWHMAALSGPWITIKTDDMEQAWFNQPSMGRMLSKGNAAIYVGKDGTRFTAESGKHRHGHINYAGSFYSQITPYPMYMIFDETARLAGPIMPNFSEDMSEEIASGLIVKADTIAELAEKIGIAVDAPLPNRTELTDGITSGVDITYRQAGLVNQVARYNQFCRDGYDLQFDRDPSTLQAIEQPPYYAIKIEPALVNTQGGPRRNTNCEILDTTGNVIPNLYGAGELGSMYGGYYTAGGNLAETAFSGRTAGKNAAQPKEDLPNVTLSVASSNIRAFESDLSVQASDVTLGENEYLGTGSGGMGGDITVKIKMDGDKIVSIEIHSHNETAGISDPAIEGIPAAIVAANSADVDAVSGATLTSNAIIAAVKDALSKVS